MMSHNAKIQMMAHNAQEPNSVIFNQQICHFFNKIPNLSPPHENDRYLVNIRLKSSVSEYPRPTKAQVAPLF